MKPKQPLPTERPFLTIFTATYKRPKGLEACLRSVSQQTLHREIQHIVLPDHVGVAPNDAVYGRLPDYVNAVRGEYVHVLGDDDVLADDRAVERVKQFAERHGNPAVIILKCRKGDQVYPKCGVHADPSEGDIDLCNYVVRSDVWVPVMRAYGANYKCDYGFYETVMDYLSDANPANRTLDYVGFDFVFAQGAVGGGRPEAVDW